jgi:chitinase
MLRKLTSLLLAAAVWAAPVTQIEERATGYQNGLYFANWDIYARNYQPQQLPVSQVTYILYAFANLGSDGTVVSSDSYADVQKHYPTDCKPELYLDVKRQ